MTIFSFKIPLEFMKKEAAATTAAVPFKRCTLWLTHNVLVNWLVHLYSSINMTNFMHFTNNMPLQVY